MNHGFVQGLQVPSCTEFELLIKPVFETHLCSYLLGHLKISHQFLRRRLFFCKREEITNLAVRKSQHAQILLRKNMN